MRDGVEFGLLGPLLVWRDENVIPVTAGRQRVLLAALLVNANRAVLVDVLTEMLWEGAPPVTARVTLQNYVRRLRVTLGDTDHSRIVTRPGGYMINVGPGELDITHFVMLRAQAREAARQGAWVKASARLRAALGLWRGPPLADVPCDALLGLEVPRLAEMRLQAVEDRIDADLHIGLHADVVAELRQLTRIHPVRERLHAMLIMALCQGGRQAEALEAYQAVRLMLVTELGIEPGPELQQAHHRALTGDYGLARSPQPAPADEAGTAIGRGSPVVPHQLPAAVQHFTGRGAETQALTRMLDEAPACLGMVAIAAIGGPPGVGKTALAVHWAHRVAGRFPDGQLFADLRGFDARRPVPPGEILGRFLRALGAGPQDIPAEVEERAALYRSLLADRRVLVMLDNALNSGQVRPLLPGSPGCLVLVTSRRRLGGLVAVDGAGQLTVEPLAAGEAVALLARLAGMSRVAAEQEAATRICELSGFLPLTVRMAAARAVARPRRSLAELAGEFARPGQRLDLTSGEEPAVREVFSWSCRALDPQAARLFGLLGLHPAASISAPCAAALAGIPEASARRQLQALAAVHLLEDDGHDRYQLPSLLRLYAAERSHDEPGPRRADALGRMLAWYLHTAAAASHILAPRLPLPLRQPPPGVRPLPLPSQAQALAWFEAERASILAVTRLAADTGQHALAWQLPIACWDFFYRRKHSADWLAASTIALASAQQAGDHYGEGWARQSLGDAYRDMRRFGEAISHLQQALAIRRQSGDRQGEGWALANLGECHFFQRRYAQALRFYQQAAAAERDAGDQWGLAISLTNAGEANRELGRFGDAFAACQQALGLHRRLDDQHSEAWTLNNLASMYQRLSCWVEALGHARQALAIQGDIDDQWGQSITLTRLAGIQDATGQPARAIECYQQALSIQRNLADQHAQAQTLTRLADVLQRTRQPEAARSCLHRARDLSGQTSEP